MSNELPLYIDYNYVVFVKDGMLPKPRKKNNSKKYKYKPNWIMRNVFNWRWFK